MSQCEDSAHLTEEDETVPGAAPPEESLALAEPPHGVAEVGQTGGETLAVVARLAAPPCRGRGPPGSDGLEDLGLVEDDRLAGGHVEQQAGPTRLVTGDGQLHLLGSNWNWSLSDGNTAGFVNVRSWQISRLDDRRNWWRSRVLQRETRRLSPLLQGRHPDCVVDILLLSAGRTEGVEVVVVPDQYRPHGVRLESLVTRLGWIWLDSSSDLLGSLQLFGFLLSLGQIGLGNGEGSAL